MSWHGPWLNEDQRAVLASLDALAADPAARPVQDPASDAVRSRLAALGLWATTSDGPESEEGTAAGVVTVSLERLGRYWPALGWASAQARAAVAVLAAGPTDELDTAGLVDRIESEGAGIVVVDAGSAHVELVGQAGRLRGTVARVDTDDLGVPLLVLDARNSTAFLIDPSGWSGTSLGESTGAGAILPYRVEVDATLGDTVRTFTLPDAGPVLTRLNQAVVTLAAGIAGAAHDAARRYAEQRHQFGAPLAQIPALRESLERQQAGVGELLAVAAHDGLWWKQAPDAARRDALERALALVSAALQVHGGYGYLAEFPLAGQIRALVALQAAASMLQRSST